VLQPVGLSHERDNLRIAAEGGYIGGKYLETILDLGGGEGLAINSARLRMLEAEEGDLAVHLHGLDESFSAGTTVVQSNARFQLTQNRHAQLPWYASEVAT